MNVPSWINKIWYMHRMGYYLAFKRKETLTHTTAWMKFKDILNEISQHKRTNNMIPLI